jgi:hypothetical protein
MIVMKIVGVKTEMIRALQKLEGQCMLMYINVFDVRAA